MDYRVLLIQIVLVVNVVLGDDCPYKECYCTGTEIVCSYRGFNAMPKKQFNRSLSLTTLYLDGNHISTIPAGSLPANLSAIFLQDNPIETIDDTAFDESIYTLQEVHFSMARFTEIPRAIFHLRALNLLQMYQTNITAWNEDPKNQLGFTLGILVVENVRLTVLPSWIKTIANLTKLIITGCSISNIPDDVFDLMSNSLKILDLSKNSLTKLPRSMSKLTVLNSLTLNYNQLIDVTWLPQSSHLSSLFLDNNKIIDAEQLSNALRPCSQTLSTFSIKSNSLTSIPELSFLTQISYLNFQFNHLTDANSGLFSASTTELDFGNNLLSSIPSVMKNLNHLTGLYLNSNNISFVQGTYIPTSVTVLDLTFNSISQVTRTSFPNNSSLNVLILNNNPLTTISPDAFSNIPLLRQLKLRSTKLTHLPLAMAGLTKLYYFDVSNITSLVCTCQEQSLQPLILSLGIQYVLGDCGVTSVYVFFKTISPQCPKASL